jgi:hypothetical protein
MQLKAAADDTIRFLKSFVWQDDGPFDSATTGRTVEAPRWRSKRGDQAIALLARHLQAGVTTRRGYVELGARL